MQSPSLTSCFPREGYKIRAARQQCDAAEKYCLDSICLYIYRLSEKTTYSRSQKTFLYVYDKLFASIVISYLEKIVTGPAATLSTNRNSFGYVEGHHDYRIFDQKSYGAVNRLRNDGRMTF